MVLYSCPHPLNAAGPSKPLTRIKQALEGAGMLDGCVSPADFPELVELPRLGDGLGPAFDDLACAIVGVVQPRFFLGGGGASLHQMEAVHAAGGRTGTLWFSSYWAHAQRVLGAEYALAGVKAAPIHPYVAWRAEQEQVASDFLIVPSEFCKGTYPEAVQQKTHVVEFGVDLEKYRPPPNRDSSGPLRVLMPATNPVRKGLRYVLQAMEQLPPGRVRLTVTGGWRARPSPGVESERVMVNGNEVVTAGWVDDGTMRAYMRDNQVLLLPSLEEGQALAALEAMASGMAVLLTPNVGVPFTPGVEGWSCRVNDPTAIAACLMDMEEDRALTERMGAAARAFAEQRPWSKFEDRIVQILKEETR